MNATVPLLRALRDILPDAEIRVIHERPWHSLTFSGAQICMSVALRGNSHASRAAAFDRTLPTHEFDLQGQLVADIAVIERSGGDNETRLLIDALVLED